MSIVISVSTKVPLSDLTIQRGDDVKVISLFNVNGQGVTWPNDQPPLLSQLESGTHPLDFDGLRGALKSLKIQNPSVHRYSNPGGSEAKRVTTEPPRPQLFNIIGQFVF